MTLGKFRRRRRARGQEGYILLVLMLMAALILIGLAMEAPAIGTQIRRDREQELIHRGAQYARAIKRYYKKFGAYPVRIEQLENTNNIRFLRKKYKDPITGQDFRLLRFGDLQLSVKSPGSSTGPGVATPTSAFSASSPTSGPGQPVSPVGPSSTQVASGGAAFGGGPIVGVASTSDKSSLHVFNEKDHYKDWEFIYDPTQDRGSLIQGPYNGPQTQAAGNIPGAVSPGQMNQPPGQPFGPSGPVGQPQPGFGQGPQPAPTPQQPSPR